MKKTYGRQAETEIFGGEGGCRSACILLDAFLDSILNVGLVPDSHRMSWGS